METSVSVTYSQKQELTANKIAEIDDTGERLIYDVRGHNVFSETLWAHMARYLHARRFAGSAGRKLCILDAASGSGYGTYLLSRDGHDCTGIDVSLSAVEFSKSRYAGPMCRFVLGDVTCLPFEDASFDMLVSFETIEHIVRERQPVFLAEIKRVLRGDGRMTMSSPVRDVGCYYPRENPFHMYEPSETEFVALVSEFFSHVDVFGQIITPRVTAAEGATPDPGTAPSAAPPSRHRTLRRIRECVRGVMNQALEHHYVSHPWLLDAVVSVLYSGYGVRSFDPEIWRTGCIVLNATVGR